MAIINPNNIQIVGDGVQNPGGSGGGLNPNLVAGYNMNEGSGLTLHDLSVNANNATIASAGAVTWQSNSGLPGTTTLWNGGTLSSHAANVAPTNFPGNTPFSVAVWLAPASAATGTIMGTLNAAASFQGWEIQINNGGAHANAIDFLLVGSYPGDCIQVDGSTSVTTGLHYVVVTYDGLLDASGVKIYVNGVADTTFIGINTYHNDGAASGLPLRFINRSDGSNSLTGAFAFAAVYNAVLSPSTIAAYYARGPQVN